MKKAESLVSSLLLISALYGNNDYNTSFSSEDLKYMMDMDVNNCQFEVYMMLLLLMEWYDEEELIWIIDNLDLDSYRKLTKQQQEYVQKDAKNILALRKERINNEYSE